MKNKSKSRPFYRALFQGNRLLFCAVMLLTVLEVFFQLGVARVLGMVIDTIGSGRMESLARPFWMMLALTGLFVLYGMGRAFAGAAFSERAVRQYKSLAFMRLSEKGVSAFARESTGRYISMLTGDVSAIEQGFLGNLNSVVFQTLLLAGSLAMMLSLSPLLTATTIVLSALPLAASMLTGKPLAKRERAVSDQNERFVSHVKDLLTGFGVIKTFQAEKEVRALFDQNNRRTEAVKRRRNEQQRLLHMVGAASGMIAQFGLFLVGAALALRGDITAGTVVIFVQMANYVIDPVVTIPRAVSEMHAAMGLIDKLAELVSESEERGGEKIKPVLEHAIELHNVCFAYEAGKPVLQNVSMRLEAGKKYALVGASGSGKSTLLSLLMGAYDSYDGSMTIDGRELREIAPESLYEMMSMIGQSVFLFDDTIRRNITMFRDDPEEQVASAAARSGLLTLLREKGPDYRCGENGQNLSGGERQRISIARCLLRNTPVLLMDEATAALDNETAFSVADAILSLSGLTRLVVTHRLEAAALEKYDEIFVLKNGRVVERGAFRALLERRGDFYSLYTVAN